MSARRFIFRPVVDRWPTADGEPFADQPLEFWEAIVSYFHNPEGDDPTPDWLPQIEQYIEDPGDEWTPPHLHKPPFTTLVVVPGEAAEYDTGYAGYPDKPVIAVPVCPARRMLQKATAQQVVDQLRAWGCTAHIERSEMGSWEVCDG